MSAYWGPSFPGPSSNPGPNPPPAPAGALSDQHLEMIRTGNVPLPEPWYDPSMETTTKNSAISEWIAGLSPPRKARHVAVDIYLGWARRAARVADARIQTIPIAIVKPKILSPADEVRYVRNESGAVAHGEKYVYPLCEACIKKCWGASPGNDNTKLVRETECDLVKGEVKWPRTEHKFHIKPDGGWFRLKYDPLTDYQPDFTSPHYRCITIYELKSIGIIHMACKDLEGQIAGLIIGASPATLLTGGGMSGSTDLSIDDRALLLIKQATAYAIGFRTKFVLMYDYLTMVLIRFDQFPTTNTMTVQNAFDAGVGNSFEITVVKETKQMVPALTGFLYRAQEEESGLGMP